MTSSISLTNLMSVRRIRRLFSGAGDYFLIVVVDLERGLRVSVFVVLACGDAGRRCEFH